MRRWICARRTRGSFILDIVIIMFAQWSADGFYLFRSFCRNSSTQPAKTCHYCRQLTSNNTHLPTPKPLSFLFVCVHKNKKKKCLTEDAASWGATARASVSKRKEKKKDEFTVSHFHMRYRSYRPLAQKPPSPLQNKNKKKESQSSVRPFLVSTSSCRK